MSRGNRLLKEGSCWVGALPALWGGGGSGDFHAWPSSDALELISSEWVVETGCRS